MKNWVPSTSTATRNCMASILFGFRALGRYDVFNDEPLISNLGTGMTHSVGDVVRTIAAAAGVTLDIQQDPSRMRAVDRPMLKASTERLKQITDWTPAVSLAES